MANFNQPIFVVYQSCDGDVFQTLADSKEQVFAIVTNWISEWHRFDTLTTKYRDHLAKLWSVEKLDELLSFFSDGCDAKIDYAEFAPTEVYKDLKPANVPEGLIQNRG
jgi:hypothetical protein